MITAKDLISFSSDALIAVKIVQKDADDFSDPVFESNKFVGLISPTGEFSFDPSEWVEVFRITRAGLWGNRNYLSHKFDFSMETPQESFLSLMESNGISPTDLKEGEKWAILKKK